MLLKLADFAYRRRRLVVAAWALALLAALSAAGLISAGDRSDYETPGSESAAAHDLLDERFSSRDGDTVEVVWTGEDVRSSSVVQRVDELLDDVAELEHVIGIAPSQVSADGTVARATVQYDTWDVPVEETKTLIDLVAAANGEGLRIEVTGQPVLNAEQGEVGSEGLGLLAAALILLIAFGSVLAMGLPILTAVFGLGVASGFIAALAQVVDVPEWATSVATMIGIGIGVGIDYALFIVTRYRSGLRDGLDPRAAVSDAIGTAGRAVLFAGGTVMISLFGMVVMRLPYLHGVAFGSVIAVGIVMAASVTLLPAVIGFVGRNIDRLHVPFTRRDTTVQRTVSYRWSRIVQRRPAAAAAVGLLALVALAAPALGLRLGFPDASSGPESLTSRRAYDLLAEGFGAGHNGTLLASAAQALPRRRRADGCRRISCRTRGCSVIHHRHHVRASDVTEGPVCLVFEEYRHSNRKETIMRVFVAGGTGVIGRRLVPQLVDRGHEVTATTKSRDKLELLRQLGADGVVMDGLDAVSVGEAVAAAEPDAIVHQMTAIAGKPDMKHPDRWFATTNRLRAEGTDHLLAAAEATGVSHLVAQSYAGWNGIREGGWVKTEEDPLDPGSANARQGAAAIRHLENVVVEADGAVLRYGWLYGPGATDDLVGPVRKRQFPLVGGGTGYTSWVHLDDAASATVLAVEHRATGVFNIVDDEPAPVHEWLPYLAARAGAKRPMRVPTWLARPLAGEAAVAMMTEGRGFCNAKAKRELGWELRYPSWRSGFEEALA